MKLSVTIILLIAPMFLIKTRAQDSRKVKAAMQQQAIQKMMDVKHFIFQAQSASPIRGGTRQLSPGYSIAVKYHQLRASVLRTVICGYNKSIRRGH